METMLWALLKSYIGFMSFAGGLSDNIGRSLCMPLGLLNSDDL